ncbi:NAD(P)/FAD-dependent oxidoreductase [Pinisolibacter aquiterrae]|uniref:geranylgeranyl reductase family protein n=1 Tax=Pinisolibacter aquiterrae TaxID=2815579 RepID=UPI001C3CF0E2|nr:NAD(P)/FAD-dependent oxidoreductase [Pinisolibacter aquiterrae]MBV5264419.1 NAD(P)/FAD-dependent oxidoreductase [Pinisolibacter aquiterrae]MCC8234432.1 NAD(P)/FAD-dependent oxidoreductase [Pinisolibacter aquiterrae]
MTGAALEACDVVVVGLGPAGASAARAAARAGARVIGLDKRVRPGEPVQCAEFVPLSLGSEVEALGRFAVQPIAAMETYTEGDGPRRDALPGWIIDRARFDAGLVEAAREAGAECRFSAPVARVDASGVTLSDGSRIEARVIVGADGPRSAVGRAIGSVNRVVSHTRQITVPLLEPHDATDIFLSATMPGGYGWLFPKGSVANLGLGVDAPARGFLRVLLEGLQATLVREGRIGWDVLAITGGLIPAGGLLAPSGRLGGREVILAGDACGLTNPITGAGIASAVISGRMAGEAAAARIAGERAALEDYAEEIEDLFAPALTRAVARREAIVAACARHRATPADLQRAWIAYDDYWTAPLEAAPHSGVAA